MVLTLRDFNDTNSDNENVSINQFQPASRPSPAANDPTVNTIASYGAALDLEGDIENTYTSILNQLSYSTSSQTLDRVVTAWQQNDTQASFNILREVMTDPTIPDTDKTLILDGFSIMRNNSLSYNVAMSSVMSPDVDDTGEGDDLKLLISRDLDRVDDYNAWAQTVINNLNNENNADFIEHTKRFIESIIPFGDAAGQAFFEDALMVPEGGGPANIVQTLLLLGENRDRLRNTLLRVPIEERQTIIQNFINVIKSSSGSLAGDVQTIRAIENLERMIIPGAYGDNEQFLDNLFSVLDDTILLAPFSRPLRAGVTALGRGVRGADAARVSEEVIARAGRGGSDLEPLPTNRSLTVVQEADRAIEMPNWTSQVDNIVDSLQIEATSSQIGELRTLINNQMNSPNFNIDEIINNARITDEMSSAQISDLRSNIGTLARNREDYLRAPVEMPPASIPEVRARYVSSNVQPTSLSSIYRVTNTDKTRAAHDMVVADESGRASNILYGTSRDNALAHDYLPEIGGNGKVASKVEFDEAVTTPDTQILRHVKDSETASWTKAEERAQVQKTITNDWKDVVGLRNRSAMGSIEDFGDGVRLKQIYGPENGGFSDAYIAVDVVRSALRKYGVTDDELTVLARQPDGNYSPVREGQNLNNGDYLIQVDYDYLYRPNEVSYTGYDVSKLWGFLRIPDIRLMNREGGILQQILPKSINIDPAAFVPGVAAADRAAGIQKLFLRKAKEFADSWKRLDRAQQAKVDEYIRIANDQEIKFNIPNLRGRGINDDGINTLSQWKSLQDTLYHLENMDVARSLRDRGYQLFEHRGTNTRLIVEEVPRTTVPTNAEVYDVVTDSYIVFSRRMIDELYDGGASIVRPRNVQTINGKEAEFILSSNDGTGFTRAIRDSDKILNYRDGYYHVRYTDPYYITKTDPKTGKTITISRAEGSRDARVEAERLNSTKDGHVYQVKKDRNDEAFNNHMDVAVNFGRSAQRIRGKRLERVRGSNDKTLSDAGIESPLDSLVRSIGSISNRTSFRNVIDAERRRWMSQFKHLVRMGEGGPKFPNSVDDILDGPMATEARHAFRHVEQLQDGYGNMVDDITKGFLSSVSELAGNMGWGWVDKMAARLAKVSPSGAARMTAFKLFLSANPIRQLPLQALPGLVVVSSLNPLAWGKIVKQMGILGAWKRGVDLSVTERLTKYGLNMKETRDMLEAYDLSGVGAAVNAHVYLADDVARLADRTLLQRGMSIAGKPLRATQSIGFDLGEQTLMNMVWLSEYDRLTKTLGRTKLTGVERDGLMSRVRALTGDMNKGGEMPYNSNSLSVLMQFLQTPHKISASLIAGHRSLTAADRAKLAAGYTLAFGIPVIPLMDQFVDKVASNVDQQTREIMKGGLFSLVMNNFLSSLTGEEVRVDFASTMQPFTLEPMMDFAANLLTMNLSDLSSSAASVSLFADGGRINNFARAVVDAFIPGEYEGVDELKQVGLTFLQMFSGLSNVMKAHYILEMGKITTSQGLTVDEDVSFMEGLAKAAGFQTFDEVFYWEGNMTKWEIDDQIQSDIETLIDDLFVKYTREGIDVAEFEQYQKIIAEAARVFNDNPAYMERVADYYRFKMRQNPQAFYRLLLLSGIYSQEEAMRIINSSSFTQEQRDTLMEMYRLAGESYGD